MLGIFYHFVNGLRRKASDTMHALCLLCHLSRYSFFPLDEVCFACCLVCCFCVVVLVAHWVDRQANLNINGQAYLNTSRANQHRRTKNSELLQLFTLAQLAVRRQDTRKAGCCVCSLESRPHLSFPQPNSSRRHSKPDIQQKECEVSEQPTEEV